jgi:signal transduction histidine kinase
VSVVVCLVLAAMSCLLGARLRTAHRLVAHASHELRGPLTAAGLALEALARGGEVPVAGVEAVASQLRRAALALDDLLVAPAGDRSPDAVEAVPVSGLLAELDLTWRPVAAARGVALRVTGSVPGGVVRADRTRLAQAAGNLLTNAFDHGAGDVELRARAVGGVLRLEVGDDGPGLPAPVASLVRRRPRGTHGHGLAIASGIASRLGGRVLAAPSARGAVVVLELPLSLASAAAGEGS